MNVNIEIPNRTISDLLITAFEQGVDYWVREIQLFNKNAKQVFSLTDDPFANLGTIVVIEDETGHKYDLSIPVSIDKGLALMAKEHPSHFGDMISGNDDATTGDVFIQCCLFGEIRYA